MAREHRPTDYTLNKEAAEELAQKIMDFWAHRGYYEVSAWVESIPIYNTFTGKKITTRYEINSNISQSVSSIARLGLI
jgi:hypothetical protein